MRGGERSPELPCRSPAGLLPSGQELSGLCKLPSCLGAPSVRHSLWSQASVALSDPPAESGTSISFPQPPKLLEDSSGTLTRGVYKGRDLGIR